VKGTRPNP